MNHILYKIFKNTMRIFKKKNEIVTDNPSIRIYINKTENRITFIIKTGYYLELLTSVKVKLCGSTKSKITKYENGEDVPHLEITEVGGKYNSKLLDNSK